MSKTPIAISVAKWTAIAAGVTAFGSMFQTMWTDRPWWMEAESAKPVPMLREMAVRKPASVVESNTESVDKSASPSSHGKSKVAVSASAPTRETQVMMSVSSDMGWWDKVRSRFEHSPWTTWMIVGSVLLTIVAKVVEFILRRRHKKFLETQSPLTS